MAGGARSRSGPQPDPLSARSERRGLVMALLPHEGYTGKVPDFPLPGATSREVEVWADAWRTPQAYAWAQESWRWPVVAEYVRLKVTCESMLTAPLIGQLHRYRDQLGLTPVGLKENRWTIAAETPPPRQPDTGVSVRRRLRAIENTP